MKEGVKKGDEREHERENENPDARHDEQEGGANCNCGCTCVELCRSLSLSRSLVARGLGDRSGSGPMLYVRCVSRVYVLIKIIIIIKR